VAKKVNKVEEELEATGHIGPDDSNLIAPEGTTGYIGLDGDGGNRGEEGEPGISVPGVVEIDYNQIIKSLQSNITDLQAEIKRLKSIQPTTVEKIVEIPTERIVEVPYEKIVEVKINSDDIVYKFNVGDEVYYPNKYQRMKFQIREHQGYSSGQPLYRIFAKHIEEEIERIPENEIFYF
jgi:hypothetical protein